MSKKEDEKGINDKEDEYVELPPDISEEMQYSDEELAELYEDISKVEFTKPDQMIIDEQRRELNDYYKKSIESFNEFLLHGIQLMAV